MSLFLLITVLILLPAAGSYEYDVFLSFRGEDTRYGFTDHLHEALLIAKIRAFRDNIGIQAGETISIAIEKAINESRISIIVFSENYANSTWCLEELAMGMKLIPFGHILVPVFYHLEPSHVEDEKGRYGEAIADHEKQYRERVERWKATLKEIAEVRGMFSSSTIREKIKGTFDEVVIAELEKTYRERVERWKTALKKAVHIKGIVVKDDGYEASSIRDIVRLIGHKLNPTLPNVVTHSNWTILRFIKLIGFFLATILFLHFLFGKLRATEYQVPRTEPTIPTPRKSATRGGLYTTGSSTVHNKSNTGSWLRSFRTSSQADNSTTSSSTVSNASDTGSWARSIRTFS